MTGINSKGQTIKLETVVADIARRVNAIELQLRPRETEASSGHLNALHLCELLVEVLPPEQIDLVLVKMRHKAGHCRLCYREEGHCTMCPHELFRLAREVKDVEID